MDQHGRRFIYVISIALIGLFALTWVGCSEEEDEAAKAAPTPTPGTSIPVVPALCKGPSDGVCDATIQLVQCCSGICDSVDGGTACRCAGVGQICTKNEDCCGFPIQERCDPPGICIQLF